MTASFAVVRSYGGSRVARAWARPPLFNQPSFSGNSDVSAAVSDPELARRA
jgi:hypothetical protein